MTTIHESRPFNLRYIVRAPISINGENMRATHRTAQCNYLYIMRENGTDEFGSTPDFAARRADLVASGRFAPVRLKASAHAEVEIWKAADEHARASRPELSTAMHAVGSLPSDGNPESWRAHITAFCEDQFVSGGMIVDWGIHALVDETGSYIVPPHVHFLITSRAWDRRRALGRWQLGWFTRKEHVHDLEDAWYRQTGLWPVT